jgi:glutathione synthase/RimK-type ligase-like ATP-grasp enzyme
MLKTTILDVLLVYSDRRAKSASTKSNDILTPFIKGSKNENYNIFYGYFLRTCQKYNLKAAFATTSDIMGAGRCSSYWLFENDKWIKVKKSGYSKLIFDKFSPYNERIENKRNLLFSSYEVKPFNHPYLFNLFFDKQKTYNKFHKFMIPTVMIEFITRENIERACETLKELIIRHTHKNDFSNEIVMKDRFGSEGIYVYKFKNSQYDEMISKVKMHKNTSFIIQPFTKFDKGYSYQNTKVSADIRLIYLGGKIIQTYIRMAKKGEFRCNEHQGGKVKYISINEVPLSVMSVSEKIAKKLNRVHSLFTLDFIISNFGNVYFLEGNTGPGLDWNLSIKENEIEAKKFINIIVKELVRLVGRTGKEVVDFQTNGEYLAR